MIKMFKKIENGLLGAIVMGNKEFWSINEALKEDLRRFKEKLPYGMAEYRGRLLCLDIESECDPDDSKFENNDFKDCESLYSNTYKQICDINAMFDAKDGE
jgi:hypothetical protein